MKTRSNMPLFVVECENVKALSDDQISLLRCGDYLVKKDASGEHAYKVTFKSDTGMCLTYYDASVIETQSYDKVGGHWVYNSEDKTPNLLDTATKEDIEGGTLDNAKPIYEHSIVAKSDDYKEGVMCAILTNSPTPFTNVSSLKAYLESVSGDVRIKCTGRYGSPSTTFLDFVIKKADNTYICITSSGTGIETQESDPFVRITNLTDVVRKIN